jgi:hypothetical protein
MIQDLQWQLSRDTSHPHILSGLTSRRLPGVHEQGREIFRILNLQREICPSLQYLMITDE